MYLILSLSLDEVDLLLLFYTNFAFLKTQSVQALTRTINNLDWITFVMMGCLCLLTLTKFAYQRRFLDFTEVLLNEKYMGKSLKDLKFENPFNMLLTTVQMLSIGFFIYLASKTFGFFIYLDEKLLFLRILIVYGLFVGIKFLTERIIAVLFNGEMILKTYHYHKLTHRNFIAVILLPINALLAYSSILGETSLLIIIAIIAALNLVLLINTLRDYQNIILNNWFYFILYLCALEIAPYFILFKLLSTYLPHLKNVAL